MDIVEDDGMLEDPLLGVQAHAIDDGEPFPPAERPLHTNADAMHSASFDQESEDPAAMKNAEKRPTPDTNHLSMHEDEYDDDDDDEGPQDFSTIDWMTFAEKDREQTLYIHQKFKKKPSLVGFLNVAYHNSQGWIALLIIGFIS